MKPLSGMQTNSRVAMLRFFAVSTAALVVAYLVAGGLAYQLLTKPLYVGPDALFARFLRSEADPALWAHTMRWQFPMLFLRSLLLALVLLPFRESLVRWSVPQRVGALAGLFFVMLHFAAAAPSPSNLEGLVYFRPELVSVHAFLVTQPEMIAQVLLASFGIAKWALPRAPHTSMAMTPKMTLQPTDQTPAHSS